MDLKVVIAYRAGQIQAQTGVSIKEAFERAAREERTMMDWRQGLKAYNASLDRLIHSLEQQRKEGEQS